MAHTWMAIRIMAAMLCLTQSGQLLAADAPIEPPPPYGPVPTARQLLWHDMEFYGFVHFTVNTFTDKEWGYGDESEKVFAPTAFDAAQIARTAKMAGMKGLVLTCKHHDGFCLWPSQYTEHSVKNSAWKNGQGDVVRELSEACRQEGLKFGVYLSPWDRNHKDYATPAYITYYRNQLRELLTNYGELFTVWFDGANGGDGFYGGARETRRIDNKVYYDWPNTWSIVRELQPNACMFSDAGPDFRWVGNESGRAGDPCWATLNGAGRYPGGTSDGLNSGERPGTDWIPAECDVSIRPGWFYHEKEDNAVKTARQLLDIYYASVGRGCCLNLNMPPDRRGQIHDNDVAALREFRRILDHTFATDLAPTARLQASNTRGGDPRFAVENLVDGKRDTYWCSENAVTTPELILDFAREVTFSVIRLREYLPLGQRIDAFALDIRQGSRWVNFFQGTSIGNQRLVRVPAVTASKIRLRILKAAACPALSELGVFAEPRLAAPVAIQRDRQGMLTMSSDQAVRYTLDGSEPGPNSARYEQPLALPQGGVVKAQAFYPDGRPASDLSVTEFSVTKGKWRMVKCSHQSPGGKADNAIDDDPQTLWETENETSGLPEEVVIDMGETLELTGMLYLPRQDRQTEGLVDKYEFYVSPDGQSWGAPVASGEASNIQANPAQVAQRFAQPVKARYFRFVALRAVAGNQASVAEIGVTAK